jgi:hypothetical protein
MLDVTNDRLASANGRLDDTCDSHFLLSISFIFNVTPARKGS